MVPDPFSWSLPLSLTLLAIAWFTLNLLLNRHGRNQPRLPPGPVGVPLLGSLPFLDPELHTYFLRLAKRHGPIVSLWLGKKLAIIVSSPTLAKEVLKDKDAVFANHDVPAAGRAATYGGIDIAWSPYGPEWRMLRKVCVREMLGAPSLDAVYGLRRREVRQMINYLYGKVGSPVDIAEHVFFTTFNVVTSMLWGGTLIGEERETLGVELRDVVEELVSLLGAPNISDFFPALARFDLQGVEKRMGRCVARFDKMFDSMIEQRMKMDSESIDGNKEVGDFLQFLLRFKDNADSQTPLTILHIKALLMDMLTGGTDTTSSTVEFAMAEVLRKPEVMKRVQQELDTVVGKDNIVEESHIHEFPYLNAVVKETLRLHPVLPLLIPHSPSQHTTVGGYSVPKGSRVFINAWAIHRDPTLWENPSEFNPDRFHREGYDFIGGNDFSYFPFGSGRRSCAGIAMAERMVLFSLASLLHSFDWRSPKGEDMEPTEKFGIVLKMKTPLVVIPSPRLSNPVLYQ